MKPSHRIFCHFMLALSLLILPLQNAWAMADMAACGGAMTSKQSIAQQPSGESIE